jgi:hypothetical protein
MSTFICFNSILEKKIFPLKLVYLAVSHENDTIFFYLILLNHAPQVIFKTS